MNTWYVIPARKNSKGLPFKNRKLFKYTANSIPPRLASKTIVTSDDEVVLEEAKKYKFKTLLRKNELALDNSSTRDVLIDVANNFSIKKQDRFVLLYLTYPNRSWRDVTESINFIDKNFSKSLLCKKKIKVSPYLIFFKEKNYKGKKVIDHDLCRRQDYKECFEVSHYIGIFEVKELENLDTNLWNSDTIFFSIEDQIDVDYQSDLDLYLENIDES